MPSYSVRTLLLTMLIVGIFLARFSCNAHWNRVQRGIVASIRELGGGVGFEEGQFESQPLTDEERRMAARKSWFDDATDKRTPNYVLFRGSPRRPPVGDKDVPALVALLRQLPRVKLIEFEDTALTEEGLRQLRAALPHCRVRIVETSLEKDG